MATVGNKALTCGMHDGEIVDVDVGASKSSGNEMVTLKWLLEGGQTLRSYHVTKNAKDGTKYAKTIAVLKSVFKEWDGLDANWFAENLDRVMGVRGRVLITYKEWNGESRPSIERIAPPSVNAAVDAPPMRPSVATSPEEVEYTVNGVWRAFCQTFPTLPKEERDAKWFAIEDSVVVPPKDQVDYTADDWRRVWEAIKAEAAATAGMPDEEEVF